jgi:hypothetical protein
MVSRRLSQKRLASLSGRVADAAEAGLWTLGMMMALVLAWWVTDRFFVAAAVGAGVMVLAAWRLVKVLTRLRMMLADTERERTAMEQALLRSQTMETLGRNDRRGGA